MSIGRIVVLNTEITPKRMKEMLSDTTPEDTLELRISGTVSLVLWEHEPTKPTGFRAVRGYPVYRTERPTDEES